MSDESLYDVGKEVGALQQQVADLRETMEGMRGELAEESAARRGTLEEHNHGDLEHALELAGLIEWDAEEESWRVPEKVVRVVRPDKMDKAEGEEE